MWLRAASHTDFTFIDAIYKEYDFVLDVKHLERLVVVEDDDGCIVAVSSLVSMLEGSFLTDKRASRKERVIALQMLIAQAETEVRALGHDNYHVFATNDRIIRVLKKSFKFVEGKGLNLLKWIEGSD